MYYAHAICLYGTDIEREEIGLIRKGLPDHEVVDPGSFQDNSEKSKEGMNYCFRMISECNALAFSRLLGKITAGVGAEVNFALSKYIPVYELKGGSLERITKRVTYLSRDESRRQYQFWSQVTGRPLFGLG